MSWDQPTYSFGTPNAQPPTPTQTPTSGQFPSPTFETPRNNTSSFEEQSGWTPTFAEEYSVFNSTPGRLTTNHPSFVDGATHPLTTLQLHRRHSNAGDIAAEIATHVHHFSQDSSLPLPPVNPSDQLPSSPDPYVSRFDESRSHITPKKPRKRLDEAFSGQTATPPATKSKGSRKLAPKLSTDGTMQNDPLGQQYGDSQTPSHQTHLLDFPTTSSDLFGYPMSAPATAPAFSSSKPFWDPDSNMGGMELDYDGSLDMIGSFSHRASNSYDWGRSNQMFQDTLNQPASSQNNGQNEMHSEPQQATSKRPRPLAPKAPQSSAPIDTSQALWSGRTPEQRSFVFDDTNTDLDVFNINPDLLHNGVSNSIPRRSEAESVQNNMAGTLQPYALQRRLAQKEREDMEEYERRTPKKDTRTRRTERKTASSPIRGSARQGLHRSMSENRGKGNRTQDRIISRSGGRVSPVKRSTNLASIPELRPPKLREEVQFVVNSKGQASVETVLVQNEAASFLGESSSDEEPLDIPSRDTSFNLPQPRASTFGHYETSNRTIDTRRHSMTSGYSQSESSRSSQRSFRQDSNDSEAETVVEEEDSGDATRELAKLMKQRKGGKSTSDTSRRRSEYADDFSSSNTSPREGIGPEGMTLSNIRGSTTRCVCKNPESRGFMIQCESCDYYLHGNCVNIQRGAQPRVYVCVFCVQTPNMRGGRIRKTHGSSPLAHKSFKSFR